MPIEQIDGNQVINRHARMNTTDFGFIDLVVMGDLPNAFSTTALPTGQVRSTGQVQNADVQCAIMLSNRPDVTKIEMWHKRSQKGQGAGQPTGDYVDKACSFQLYNEDGTPGPLVECDEVFPHQLTYPATDVANEGEASQFMFTVTVRNPYRVPGT